MSCHVSEDAAILEIKNKILLMGNPNVGKSIFFSELTGIRALSSNYAGTTVTFTEGRFPIGDTDYTLIDVPGTYSLAPTSEAEAVATRFTQSNPEAIICVIDASNLERNLRLALEIKRYKIPMVVALNLSDVALRHGININVELLEKELGAPVVKTVAVKGQGIDELVKRLEAVLKSPAEKCSGCGKCATCGDVDSVDSWKSAKEIFRRVVKKDDVNLKFIDRLGDNMMKPFPGVPIAIVVMAALVGVVVYGGRLLRMPLIMLTDGLIIPFFRGVFEWIFAAVVADGTTLSYRRLYYDDGFYTGFRTLIDGSFQSVEYVAYSGGFAEILLNVLVGEYGLFVISFQWIIALILPYVFSFYAAITFLEDSGYLPRLSVLFDNIMRKLGVQGGSLIHVFLALGCAVPAILGSRTATTQKEKKMLAAIICFTIPCVAQVGALAALLGAFSWRLSVLMVLFAIFMFVVVSLVAGKLIKGEVDPLIIEVPNLLMPNPKSYFRKLVIRMKHFLKDAELPMLAAVFLAAVLAGTGVIQLLANQPQVQLVVSGWLGMPEEAVVSLILGIVRREMSVAPLLLLDLTYLQVFVAGVVSLLYLPCLSVFGVLTKEFGIKFALIIFAGTIVAAIFVGGVVNQIGQLLM
ncbi:MAG: ferrous iron transporter B [Defluviitaleaceae bacterium]|nr:ferrous iron transporter B [Defluviitaleaceae bacterium]